MKNNIFQLALCKLISGYVRFINRDLELNYWKIQDGERRGAQLALPRREVIKTYQRMAQNVVFEDKIFRETTISYGGKISEGTFYFKQNLILNINQNIVNV